MPAERLAQSAQGYCSKVKIIDDVGNAIAYAQEMAQEDDFILVTGSLFTVGEARDYIVSKGE
jgi:dihydrofolate synthase/folylpolyglutamate synthase